MAKTKRAKSYKFTETKKQTKEGKEKHLKKIMGLIKTYKNIFVLELMNLTTETQTSLRVNLKGDFYFGKKTLILKGIESTGDKYTQLKEFINGMKS